MDKKIKKTIVNGLTISRMLGTILLPILFNVASPLAFLLSIGMILSTDFLDGFLARKWDVCTIFGSLLDMTADKLLAMALLITLSTMYPIMLIPLALEHVIASTNIKSNGLGVNGKSSQIGRIKTVLMGLSMIALFAVGMSPKIIEELKLIKLNDVAYYIENVLNTSKKTIELSAKAMIIIPESVVTVDYINKSLNNKDINEKRKITIEELKKYKEFIKKVILDEEYYKKTKDLELVDKLLPNEDIKKLVLKNDYILDN